MLLSTTRELLDRYTPADALEAQYHRRMLDLCQVGQNAFARNQFVPGHFTASAFVLSPSSNELLLILHSKLGLWLQPGGHLEPSDGSLQAAAQRELLEETGLTAAQLVLDAPLDLDVHVIPARKEMPAHEHFDVRFLFRATSTEHHAQSDALAAKWVKVCDLDGLATDESVLRAVRKLRDGNLVPRGRSA